MCKVQFCLKLYASAFFEIPGQRDPACAGKEVNLDAVTQILPGLVNLQGRLTANLSSPVSQYSTISWRDKGQYSRWRGQHVRPKRVHLWLEGIAGHMHRWASKSATALSKDQSSENSVVLTSCKINMSAIKSQTVRLQESGLASGEYFDAWSMWSIHLLIACSTCSVKLSEKSHDIRYFAVQGLERIEPSNATHERGLS